MKARASRQEYRAGIKCSKSSRRRCSHMEYIAFDVHKHYTWAAVEDERGRIKREGKIPHARGLLQEFLKGCEPGSPVAVETVGNWYWIVDEIKSSGFNPKLVHAGKARLMMGMVNKTDKLDAHGLNQLQRTGTLPAACISQGSFGMLEIYRGSGCCLYDRGPSSRTALMPP